MAVELKNLTKRSENYSQWYNELVVKADLVEQGIVKEVKYEIGRLKNVEPQEEEMVMVRNYMMGDICRAYENSLSISEAWIYVLTAGVDDDFFDRSVDSIRNISGKRIMELANKYLNWDDMVEVVAGNVEHS